MQCSNLLLHRSKTAPTLQSSRADSSDSAFSVQQLPPHVMFPARLNKLLSVWGARQGPRPPGRLFRRRRLSLALQGGGAHGAYTWGVLDQLLEDGRIAIDGISGTSAGAVNAVMLADGLAQGGPDEAQRRLADFWRAASFGGNLPDLQRAVV